MRDDVDRQPLATVNGRIIYVGALTREIEQLAATVHGIRFEDLVPSQRAELKKNAITKLIREELVLESDLAVSVQPSDTELQTAMDEAELTILVQGGDDLVEDEGFLARLRESMCRELIIHHVIDLFQEAAEVSDEEVERRYNSQTVQPGMSRFVREEWREQGRIFL